MIFNKEKDSRKSGDQGKSSRSPVIQLNYTSRTKLLKSYISFFKSGGLFYPTRKPYKLDQDVFVLVQLPNSSKPSAPIKGKVSWVTPSGATSNHPQGVGIELRGREGDQLKKSIEGILGAKLNSPDSPSYIF